MKSWSVTIQMKANEQYFAGVCLLEKFESNWDSEQSPLLFSQGLRGPRNKFVKNIDPNLRFLSQWMIFLLVADTMYTSLKCSR